MAGFSDEAIARLDLDAAKKSVLKAASQDDIPDIINNSDYGQEDLLATFTDYIERSRPLESFISLKEIAKTLTPAKTAPSRRKNRRLPKVTLSARGVRKRACRLRRTPHSLCEFNRCS